VNARWLDVGTFEEWRVTGDPGRGYPLYDFVFGSPTRRAMGEDTDPETAARDFLARTRDWLHGPRLQSRTVTYTEWVDR